MVCTPTASGKSLVAYMGIVNQLLTANPGSRGIYIVPLKALATEKLEEPKQLVSLPKIGLGIGDTE